MTTMPDTSARDPARITLFLCGDVMTGRGIDRVLPHPSNRRLHEPSVSHAARYVEIAEAAHGPIPKPVDFSYIWGDALAELERVGPDARIINLETSVTTSEDYWKGKGINYRMHPDNVACLTAARIDCCVLANNHVLDWGYAGLEETLATLRGAGLKTAGAGHNAAAAGGPALIDLPGKGRVLVFSFGAESSGIPREWAATDKRPGINLLRDLSRRTVKRIGKAVQEIKRAGDIVVASLHWGPNWGYEIPGEQADFAHALIDAGGVDVVHGHSSHHPKGIEVYQGKPIFYGCGDFLNDYEGIRGYEQYRDDLSLMYLVTLDGAGRLLELQMVPMQIRRFRLNRASADDAQ